MAQSARDGDGERRRVVGVSMATVLKVLICELRTALRVEIYGHDCTTHSSDRLVLQRLAELAERGLAREDVEAGAPCHLWIPLDGDSGSWEICLQGDGESPGVRFSVQRGWCPVCGCELLAGGENRKSACGAVERLRGFSETRLGKMVRALCDSAIDGKRIGEVDLQAFRDLGLVEVVEGRATPTADFRKLVRALYSDELLNEIALVNPPGTAASVGQVCLEFARVEPVGAPPEMALAASFARGWEACREQLTERLRRTLFAQSIARGFVEPPAGLKRE